VAFDHFESDLKYPKVDLCFADALCDVHGDHTVELGSIFGFPFGTHVPCFSAALGKLFVGKKKGPTNVYDPRLATIIEIGRG